MRRLNPSDLERLRRSVVMLSPGQPATVLKREEALEMMSELQRVQGLLKQAIFRLRTTLETLEEDPRRGSLR